jgi:hypothetical protein
VKTSSTPGKRAGHDSGPPAMGAIVRQSRSQSNDILLKSLDIRAEGRRIIQVVPLTRAAAGGSAASILPLVLAKKRLWPLGPKRTKISKISNRSAKRTGGHYLGRPELGEAKHPAKGRAIRCVGRCDEWHLDLGNTFRHLAFHLGAGLGHPAD